MDVTFHPATKRTARLRMALIGPSGSGKTYTALKLATALVPQGRIAVLDTEHGSASKYADLFQFDVVELDDFAPENYIAIILAAQRAGYDTLVIDSLSHEWVGKGGALELVDRISAKFKGNSFAAWGEVTPRHNALVEAILASNLHIITTMRSKMEYVIETRDGKATPRKVGMAPVQRDGIEYEHDIVGEMDSENTLVITKTRCPALTGTVWSKPGDELAAILRGWLSDGDPATAEQRARREAINNTLAEQIEGSSPWTRDTEAAQRFFKWATDQGLNRSETLQALGVDDLKNYTGDKTEAAKAVRAFIAQHMKM